MMGVILTVILAVMPIIAAAQGAGSPTTLVRQASLQGSSAQAKPAPPVAAARPAAPPVAPAYTPDKNKLSYALGMDIGAQFKERSMDVDPEVFARGMRDVLSGARTDMTAEEARATIAELQKYLTAKQAAEARAIADRNKADGEAFLAANKTKPGVLALPSGVQYTVLTAGTGRKPVASDQVVCHYRGTLINGTEFDSSYKGKEPATFPVQKVIKGWTEVLQLMPVGSKWRVFVPSDMAYGERGAPGAGIGPNTALVFEIELIAVK
jgi:FKBP-type peptidyl-prolyl cis-trans isomerase FklB